MCQELDGERLWKINFYQTLLQVLEQKNWQVPQHVLHYQVNPARVILLNNPSSIVCTVFHRERIEQSIEFVQIFSTPACKSQKVDS